MPRYRIVSATPKPHVFGKSCKGMAHCNLWNPKAFTGSLGGSPSHLRVNLTPEALLRKGIYWFPSSFPMRAKHTRYLKRIPSAPSCCRSSSDIGPMIVRPCSAPGTQASLASYICPIYENTHVGISPECSDVGSPALSRCNGTGFTRCKRG
jgi:hypothetical protein